MTHALVRDALASGPALLAVAGLRPEDEAALRATITAAGRVVDLDTADPGVPLAGPPGHVAAGSDGTPAGSDGGSRADAETAAVALVARTFTDLRRAAAVAAVLPRSAHIVVAVMDPAPERRFAVPPALPEWRVVSVRAERDTRAPGDGADAGKRTAGSARNAAGLGKASEPGGPASAGGWAVAVRFERDRPAGEFVGALVRGLDGPGLPEARAARVALTGAGAAHWRPGDTAARPVGMGGPLGDPGEPPPADLVLRSTGPDPVPWTDPRVHAVDRPRTGPGTISGVDALPPVDERSVNPGGFVFTPDGGDGVLTADGERWSIRPETARGGGPDARPDIVRFHPSGAVSDADVARLRRLRAVTIDWTDRPGSPVPLRITAGLAAAGVPLRAPRVPEWAGALGAGLGGLLTAVDADDLADDLRREEHSVRLRRAALRTHSVRARWRNLAAAAGLAPPAPPKVSVILCTRRPEYAGFALRQIARQRDVDLEVVLTLHGVPAGLPEVKAAVAEFTRPITVVEAAAEVPFGTALNEGAARASGRYLAKWDDDDWYGPDFLSDMLLASSYSGADLVGCMAQFVYLGQIDLTIFRAARNEWYTRLVSGGTFVLERSAFDAVGGFPPVPRSVDAALLDALTAAGGRIYRTHGLGYALHRRATGHTWSTPVTYFLRSAAYQWRGPRFSAFIEPDEVPAAPHPAAEIPPRQ